MGVRLLRPSKVAAGAASSRLCTPQGISQGNDFLHHRYVMDTNDVTSIQDGGGNGGCRSFHPFSGFPTGDLANERFP